MEQPQHDDGFYILSSLRIFKGGQRNSFFFIIINRSQKHEHSDK